jgi:hypothetical protein
MQAIFNYPDKLKGPERTQIYALLIDFLWNLIKGISKKELLEALKPVREAIKKETGEENPITIPNDYLWRMVVAKSPGFDKQTCLQAIKDLEVAGDNRNKSILWLFSLYTCLGGSYGLKSEHNDALVKSHLVSAVRKAAEQAVKERLEIEAEEQKGIDATLKMPTQLKIADSLFPLHDETFSKQVNISWRIYAGAIHDYFETWEEALGKREKEIKLKFLKKLVSELYDSAKDEAKSAATKTISEAVGSKDISDEERKKRESAYWQKRAGQLNLSTEVSCADIVAKVRIGDIDTLVNLYCWIKTMEKITSDITAGAGIASSVTTLLTHHAAMGGAGAGAGGASASAAPAPSGGSK